MTGERVAVIDIGSNSARLALLEVFPDRAFKLVDELRETLRLGEQLDADGNLTGEAIERTLEISRVLARFCTAHRVTHVIGVATSALRRAHNGPAIVDRIKAETGLRVSIISGDEEAYYDYVAAVNSSAVEDCVAVDIGGGSVQIVRAQQRAATHKTSLPLGSITLTTAFLNRDKPANKQLRALEKHIDKSLRSLDWLNGSGASAARSRNGNPKNRDAPQATTSFAHYRAPTLIGIGGTVRNLAKIFRWQTGYPLDLLHGMILPIDAVEDIYAMLRKLSLEQRRKVPGLSTKRADIIVAGTAVLCSLARTIGAKSLAISGRGLREGLFFNHVLGGELVEPRVPDPALFSTTNLMRFYNVDEPHANHVADLALSLFDQLTSVHGLDAEARRLLQIAALLHDVGVAVNYYNHDEHGFYLLTRTGIDGLTHRELLIVACLVAMHNGNVGPLKRWPEYRTLLRKGDMDAVTKLGAILQLSEALDRGESGLVESASCTISRNRRTVALHLTADPDAVCELRETHAMLTDIAGALGVHFKLDYTRGELQRVETKALS
ncbi:MAG: Ppx/GppA phosphatase family protein [Chloroflexota bacterium]|nr:Ppx/GppA phosphatase family protein [Chloroflexota bacterium]